LALLEAAVFDDAMGAERGEQESKVQGIRVRAHVGVAQTVGGESEPGVATSRCPVGTERGRRGRRGRPGARAALRILPTGP
jgi:hypothetical protein